MMPNSFPSIVGVKFELLTVLNQSMTFFTKLLTNSQSIKVNRVHRSRDIRHPF